MVIGAAALLGFLTAYLARWSIYEYGSRPSWTTGFVSALVLAAAGYLGGLFWLLEVQKAANDATASSIAMGAAVSAAVVFNFTFRSRKSPD